jgi:CheY-like chemotaxis protein
VFRDYTPDPQKGGPVKVLIAEDDRASNVLLRKILEGLGHRVVATANGAEAVEQLTRNDDIQVVITDWMMPIMDGLALCQHIRAREHARYVYVLVVTARRGKKRYVEALEAGADDFIPKPIEPEELGARLRVAERILGLQAEMKQLQGLLSICAYCKNIRESEQNWVPIEQYVSKRAHTMFSHGICPSCVAKHFRESSEPARPTTAKKAGPNRNKE